MLATIRAIETALGPKLTPQRSLILANLGRKLRDLAKCESYEDELRSIIDKRRRSIWPVTEQKWKLLESINRDIERVGLELGAKKAASLEDVVASFVRRDDEESEPEPTAADGAAPGEADEPESGEE